MALTLHVRKFRVADGGRSLEGRDAGIHGACFDGADHAFGDERDDVAAKGVFERRLADRLQERQQAVHRGGPGIEQRLELEMQIGVANLVHADLVIARGRGDDDVIGAIDAGVGLTRIEQRLQHDGEAALRGRVCRHFEIGVRADDHSGQRVMQAVDDGVVLRAHADPDVMEVDFACQFADKGQDFDYLGRVRRHLGERHAVGQLRRRRGVEGERNILREVVAGVRKLVLADVGAELVAGVLRFGRGLNGGIDLIADLLADGCGLVQAGVITAGIQRGGDVEDGLAGLKADLRARGIDERGRLLDLGLYWRCRRRR